MAKRKPRVSLCMIVQDEEARLPASLGAAIDLVDEAVVVDTGSSDRTKQRAAELGARVADFAWADGYSAARNHAKRLANGRWIFVLDAGDWLDDANRVSLKRLFASLRRPAAYAMQVRIGEAGTGSATLAPDPIRLFPNHPEVWWERRVHEQIGPSLSRAGIRIKPAEAVIHHGGHEPETLRRMLHRNLELLHRDLVDDPNDAATHFHLAQTFQALEDWEQAITHWRQSLHLLPEGDGHGPLIYCGLIAAYGRRGQFTSMLYAGLAGLARYPDSPVLLFRLAQLLRQGKDLPAAAACLERLTALFQARNRVSTGLPAEYECRHMMGLISRETGNLAEAEVHLRRALEHHSGHVPSWLELGQLLIDAGRWEELATVIAHLETTLAAPVEAALLKTIQLAQTNRLAQAREEAEAAATRHPGAIPLRLLLGRLYLMPPADLVRAREAAQSVLFLDPANSEAQETLARLKNA